MRGKHKNGQHPNSLANLKPIQPGEARNPNGRKSAGATIREWVNSFAEADLNIDQLRKIAKDPKEGWTRRAAAERIIRTMESGDLADFEDVIQGRTGLKDLRQSGIITEVVKKLRQKSRRVPVGDGETEEIIEREIELHDRAGADFDRVVEQTDGTPVQRQAITQHSSITIETAQARIDAILRRHLGNPGGN
jgi:hypothetical protein